MKLDVDVVKGGATVLGILLGGILLGCLIAYGVVPFIYSFSNQATVSATGVQVRDLSGGLITNIDWQDVTPGTNKTIPIFVFNNGTTQVTLELDATSWNPITAIDYASVTWNYTGQVIEPHTQIPIALTLITHGNMTGFDAFSFYTHVTGS